MNDKQIRYIQQQKATTELQASADTDTHRVDIINDLISIHKRYVKAWSNLLKQIEEKIRKHLTAFTEELSENENVQKQLERQTKLRTLCETRWSSRADSLYTFRTAFEVVVSALNSLKDDNDDKAAQSMNAILRFEFIISLVVAEHILSSTVALTNYLQKTDIDLIESLTEAKIVIHRQLVKDPSAR
ncbi:unnamed protein product [Mytilus edulis]|uniref:Uncharacterized protein n=1 Tax=Mytilus edulis TaxID=6550 RepID=A0A8S3TLJ2_MYTED|nr:unnamed protein product [Mytilus edulis]